MSEKSQVEKKQKKSRGHFSLRLAYGSDIVIHMAMLFLMAFGLIMIGSASMGLAVGNNRYLAVTEIKQIVFLLAGYFMMAKLSNAFSLRFLHSSKFPSIIILMEIALLVCLAFPSAGGAKGWIRIPLPRMEVTLQPSEFAKVVSILIVAGYTGEVKKRFKSRTAFLLKPVLFIGIYIFTILVLQSDLGSAAVIALISMACFMIPNHPQMRLFQHVLQALFVAGVIAAVYLLSPAGASFIESLPIATYQKNRFLSAINPFMDQYGSGYQLVNGLVSFASGGWFGVGFGNSVRKYTDFPAANTDFILAIVVEELGFVGFLLLMTAYAVIIFRLLFFAMKIKNEQARIILVGTAMYFLVHIIFNVGGVTGFIPLTGVPLLMISSGGSSTLSIMMCVGIAQGVIAAYNRGEIR